ncbi:MAG: hypothetical protein E6J70_06090 [Deltaproteobacteria bacterium]|nr:MAG: hypothetical protein E6J70_06090 [Deltaproteobacteria bacterium]
MSAMLTGFSSSAGSTVSVMRGGSYGSRIFPDNAFTVADASQLTGRRINFREGIDYPNIGGVVQPSCTNADYSICDAFAQLNKLDGFDLQPRVLVPFTGAINLGSVNASDFFISTDKGDFFSGLRQLTFDPATKTLAGISDAFLSEGTSYRIHVTNGILDTAGHHVHACGGTCVVRFTTRTATGALVRIRQSMDLPLSNSANAYVLAGFPSASTSTASRKLTFTQNGVNDVFLAASVEPSLVDPFDGIVRTDQVKVDPTAPGAFQLSAVPNLIPPGTAGYYAFGSFLSPRYQFASASGQQDNPYGVGDGFTDGEIPPVPTTQMPVPFGADRLGVIVVTPDPAVFPPPWPAAIYGPGFTRSDYDLFVTADYNASLGIVTLATDPSGHGFGPLSTTTVTANGTPTTFLSYGRGRDLDGDGVIGDGLNDGVGPTGHVQPDGSELPSRKPIDGLASGLIQTVVDNMALGRALQELFANTNWYDRKGSPETFAPRIRLQPDPAWASNPKNFVYQLAYADGTATDVAGGTIVRAGAFFDRVVFYRNDKTPTYSLDPHGWLADPRLAGRTAGEQQLGLFLSTGQVVNTNPAWLEVPIADPNNLECLHYADPQTGQDQVRQPYPASGDCPPLSSDG